MEAHSGDIFHASTSILEQFDNSQRHFLEELNETEATGFLKFNFAPPTLRRNIAVLGMIHKKVLGKCHPSFDKLLPSKGYTTEDRHSKQIYGHWFEIKEHRALFNRSIFGMVDIYNNLPQAVVELSSVSSFQGRLTEMRENVASAMQQNGTCRSVAEEVLTVEAQMLMDKRTLKKICLNWISSVYLHVQNSFLARHGLAGLLYIIVDISKFILCQCFIACSLFFHLWSCGRGTVCSIA